MPVTDNATRQILYDLTRNPANDNQSITKLDLNLPLQDLLILKGELYMV